MLIFLQPQECIPEKDPQWDNRKGAPVGEFLESAPVVGEGIEGIFLLM